MGLLGNPTKKQSAIGSILDDLTHLEINTVIKKGMTGTAPPESMEELLSSLFNTYVGRISLILNRPEIDVDHSFDHKQVTTLNALATELEVLQQAMDENEQRLDDRDYIIYLRIATYCKFIRGTLKNKSFFESKTDDFDLMNQKMVVDDFQLPAISHKIKVRLKRYHDLGTEEIVFQTRFGLDGDVITRVSEDFAQERKQALLDIHEKHINLSLNYWKDMVQIVINVIGEIFNNKSKD